MCIYPYNSVDQLCISKQAALAQHLQSTYNVKIDVSRSTSSVKINGDVEDVKLAKEAIYGMYVCMYVCILMPFRKHLLHSNM